MRGCNSLRLSTAVVAVLAFVYCAPSSTARLREDPVMATSADDVKFRNRIIALSPTTVRLDEAQRVAACAYTTGQELQREWRVVWPAGVQNFLVNTGRRKGGLCFQWATELLIRLDAMKLQTLELHWAESLRGSFQANTMSSWSRPKVSPLSRAFCSIIGATGETSSTDLSRRTPTTDGRKTVEKLPAG